MNVITLVTDTKAFVEEVAIKFPSYIEYADDGSINGVNITHTPQVKNENMSLAYSMLTVEQIAEIRTLTTVKILGTYEEMFANEENLALYKSVYPYDIPIIYQDEEDVEHSYMRPEKIGEFA